MGEELQETHSQYLAKNCDVPSYADPLSLKTGASFVVYIVGCIWILLGLRVVSERYFARSIEGIISTYKVPPNIAGATLMAAGTSAPELIASLVGVFLSSKVETGAGTVIGSVIFNQLMIIGLCIIVSPNGKLACSPVDMSRDLIYYAISIGIFVWFFYDEQVTLGEAWGFVGAYILYVVICGNWTGIDARLRRALGQPHDQPEQADQRHGTAPETPKKIGSSKVMPTPQGHCDADIQLPAPAKLEQAVAPDTSIGFLPASSELPFSPPSGVSIIPIKPIPAHRDASGPEEFRGNQGPSQAEQQKRPSSRGIPRAAWAVVDVEPDDTALQGRAEGGAGVEEGQRVPARAEGGAGAVEEGQRASEARGAREPHPLSSNERADSFFNRIPSLGSMRIPPLIQQGSRASLGLQVYGPAGGFGGVMLRVGSTLSMKDVAQMEARTQSVGRVSSAGGRVYSAEGGAQQGQMERGEGQTQADEGSMEDLLQGRESEMEGGRLESSRGGGGHPDGESAGHGHGGEEEEELSPLEDYRLACEGGLLSRVFFALESFWVLAVWLSCGWFRTHKWYLSSFCVCLCWFTLHCVYLIFWLEKAGCVISISPGVMGVVFGAAGTSIPDCLCSLFVARKGLGSMALTNVWGSNVFDLLFALGVPWVCSLHVHGGVVKVQGSNSLSIWMGGLLVFFVLVSILCNFHYNRLHGYMFVGLYVLFIAYNFANDSLHFAA